jgi:hypothetical protein
VPDLTTGPNVAPVASFTVNCPQATCTVDATGSSDTPPGTIVSCAWNFGDGGTGTGLTANLHLKWRRRSPWSSQTTRVSLCAGNPHGQPDRRDRAVQRSQAPVVPDKPRNNPQDQQR